MEKLREQQRLEKQDYSQKRIETETLTQKSVSFTLSKQVANEAMKEIKKQRQALIKEQKITLNIANEYLENGAMFIKYGRQGKPKPMQVFLY